jgi:GT2 family glycosyltransferase
MGGRRILANQFKIDGKSSIQRYFEFNAERKGSLINSSSAAIKRELWTKIGGFREAYRLAEDADFWARLCLFTDFAIHHTPSSVYYQDQSGASTRTRLYVGDAPFADLASKIPADRQWAYNEFLAHWRMISLALGTLLSGNKVLVRKMAKESLGTTYKNRAILFTILSVVPLSVLKKAYLLYRLSKKNPIPLFLSVKRNMNI